MTLAQVDQILDRGDDLSPPWAAVDQKSLGQIGLTPSKMNHQPQGDCHK